jgi:hypothetical protein
MALWLSLISGVIGFFALVVFLDFRLNQNDDATTSRSIQEVSGFFQGR